MLYGKSVFILSEFYNDLTDTLFNFVLQNQAR